MAIEVPGFAQTNSNGPLFYDQSSLYVFSGWSEANSKSSISTYNVSTGEWMDKEVSALGSIGDYAPTDSFSGTSDLPSGKSFVLGADPLEDGATDGLVIFDASDPEELVWHNEKETESLRDVVPRGFGGNVVNVRYGAQGVLVSFGGYDTTKKAAPGSGYRHGGFEYRSFADVDVYDIASHTW